MYISKKYMAIFIVWFLVCFYWKEIGLPRDLVKWLWWLPFNALVFAPIPLWFICQELFKSQKEQIERIEEETYPDENEPDDQRWDKLENIKRLKRDLDLQMAFVLIVLFALVFFVAFQGGKVLKIPILYSSEIFG